MAHAMEIPSYVDVPRPINRAKTLFATHYHELNEMTNYFPRIKNFNVSVKELNNKIIFLRKLAEGGSEHSFGIHVARMAGMPKEVISRANVILKKLEDELTKDKSLILDEIDAYSTGLSENVSRCQASGNSLYLT